MHLTRSSIAQKSLTLEVHGLKASKRAVVVKDPIKDIEGDVTKAKLMIIIIL